MPFRQRLQHVWVMQLLPKKFIKKQVQKQSQRAIIPSVLHLPQYLKSLKNHYFLESNFFFFNTGKGVNVLCISQHPAGDRNRLGAILFLSQRLSVIYSSVANNNASVCVFVLFLCRPKNAVLKQKAAVLGAQNWRKRIVSWGTSTDLWRESMTSACWKRL